MTGSERGLTERPELGDARSQRLLAASSNRSVTVTIAVLAVIAIALSVAAIGRIDGWASLVVLGGIVMTTVGLMIALSTR